MTIVEFLATGTGASIIAFGFNEAKAWFSHRKKSKSKDAFINGMRSASRVYSCMQDIKEKTRAIRVMLIEVTNGGNNPKPGSIMYARAIEAKALNFENERALISRHDNVRIDDAYKQMCTEAYTSGKPYVFEVQTHRECLLKSIYLNEDIEYSEIHYLHTDVDKKKMFILSISTDKGGVRFDEIHERAIINLNVAQIISEFFHFNEILK